MDGETLFDRLWIPVWNEDAEAEGITETDAEGVVELEIDPVWDSSGETDIDGTKLGVSKEDHDGSAEADTSEVWEIWDVLEADNTLVSVGFGVGDIVCSGVLEPYGLSEWRDVWDTALEAEVDIDASGEPDGNEDGDISGLGEFEKLAVCVSMELWELLRVGVVVNDPWPDGVDDTVGLTVPLGDADKDIWDVEVFDTEVDPDTVLDLMGVADVLGETVWDLDTTGVKEPLGVRVPVLVVDVDLETELVEDELDDSVVEGLLVVETELETETEAVEEGVDQEDMLSELLWEDDPVYDKVSSEEIDGFAVVDGAAVSVACDLEADTDGVYEFVTVFLTKLSVLVWEEVVDPVEVIVCVLEPNGDLEIVGEADLVLVTEADAEMVLVLNIVLVTIELADKLLRLVDVLDIELDLVFVGEAVWDLDTIELKEFVCVWTWDLDALGLPEYEDVWEEHDVRVGVTVGTGIGVDFADDVNVAELHAEIIEVLECVGEGESDLVPLDDAEDVDVCVCVLETCIEDVTVAVWNLGVNVPFGE